MKKVFSYLVVFVMLFSCSMSDVEFEIRKEYERLEKKYDREIEIKNIEVLISKEYEFERLADFEIKTREDVDEFLNKQLQMTDTIVSLINLKLDSNKCLFKNVNSESTKSYKKEMKSDSIMLNNNLKKRLRLKIEILENANKILKIIEMSKDDSVLMSKNYKVKHVVNLMIDKKIVVDTLYYISFNNNKFNYLSKNVLLSEVY